MVEVKCPSCREAMGIEENEPNVEWECPACESVFRVVKGHDGALGFDIVAPSPMQSGAITAESTPGRGASRRRKKKSPAVAPREPDADLNVSLPNTSPWQDRFPDLQPGNPPSLFTFNGIGTTMYGSRDFDEATGTYVASACLVVFFVPIFILGSYRVADAQSTGWNFLSGSSWHVLGRVPMSPLARGWNWAMLCAIALIFLAILFSR